jgi:hypothetical protein
VVVAKNLRHFKLWDPRERPPLPVPLSTNRPAPAMQSSSSDGARQAVISRHSILARKRIPALV